MSYPNSPLDGTYLKDDFVTDSAVGLVPIEVERVTDSFKVGELDWKKVTIGTAPVFSNVAGQNGILRITTAGDADGDGTALVLHPDSVTLAGTNQQFRFRVRFPSATGNVLAGNNFRIGLFDSVTATEPTVGVWVDSNSGVVELDGASTNGDKNTVAAGVSTSAVIAAAGTLTIAEPVTTTDQFTVGSIEYTLITTPVAAYDIAIGANEAATKVNIVAAINASGTAGTEYFAGTLINPDVYATTFVDDACVLTARAPGHAGNSLVSAESGNELTHESNVFDAATLGTTTIGVNFGSTMVLGTWYTFDVQFSGVNANGGPDTIKLFVDSDLVAQIDNYLLGSAEVMAPTILHWQDSGGAATLELDVDFVEYWLPRN